MSTPAEAESPVKDVLDDVLEFTKADVPLLCGTARWVLRPSLRVFEYTTGPHGSWLDGWAPDGTQICEARVTDQSPLESFNALPHNWAEPDFLLAWTFWARGYEKGYAHGGYEERLAMQRRRNYEESRSGTAGAPK